MKAVVFIADGSEEIEMITPVDYLRRAGVEVALCSVGSSDRTVTCSHGVRVTADFTLEEYTKSFPVPRIREWWLPSWKYRLQRLQWHRPALRRDWPHSICKRRR